MADINISVALDSAKAEQSAKNLDDKLKGMGSSADKAQGPFSGLWKQIFAGVTVTALVSKGVHEFTDFIKGSVTAAIEAEKAQAALRSALSTTGREVDGNAEAFSDYAKSLMKVTVYDDEVIKGAQAMLLQLTRLDNEGINQATRGAIGLASVFGIDLESAATIVGKALSGNLSVLSRYGIQMKEGATAAEKKADALKQLEIMYGRATDATQTFDGQLLQAKNQLNEAQEAIGNAMIPALARMTRAVVPVVEALFSLGEANDYVTKAGDRQVQTENNLLNNLSMAAAKCKITGQAWDDLTEKYIKNARADESWVTQMTVAINKGKEGAAMQAALSVEGEKHAAVVSKQRKELDDFRKRMEAANDETKKAVGPLRTWIDVLNSLGIKALPQVQKEIANLRNDQDLLDKAFKKGEISAVDYGEATGKNSKKLKDLEEAAKKTAKAIDNQLVPAARDLNKEFAKTPVVIDLVFKEGMPKWIKAIKDFVEKYKKEIDAMLAIARLGIGVMDAAWNNYYIARTNEIESEQKKKQEAMDAEYERRRADIENSTLSEDEKQAALAKLDKEYKDAKELAEKDYEAKKKVLQKQAAERQKSAAIVQAVINVAEAITKAWALGPIIGPILAGLAAAMGAVQIALIKSQAIPLAKGAIFDRPTLLAGGRYEVGDAGKEAALPVEPLMKRIEAAVKGRDMQITIPVSIYLDGQKIDQRIIKVVKKQGDLGRLKLASKTVS